MQLRTCAFFGSESQESRGTVGECVSEGSPEKQKQCTEEI